MNHQFRSFPELVNGYELNPNHGYFSVIVPEATTNLCQNPSFETVSTGWALVGGTIARSTDWQAFGGYSLKCTPAVATESGAYYGGLTLEATTTYTASIVFQGDPGKIYYIWIATSAGALLSSKVPHLATGKKQRIWVTYYNASRGNRRIYITRDGKYSDQRPFYIDGLQVEAKAYPTTYCDGDQKGFLLNENAYQWSGMPHFSTSTRSAQTRTGGKEMKLRELGLTILAIMGLGMAPLVDQSLPIPGLGEIGQGTGTVAREFVIIGALVADGRSGRHLQSLRNGLIDVFKPDLTAKNQPLILRYQACDEDGGPISESLDIVCKYRGGLEGNWDNQQQERLALSFKMYLPFIQKTYFDGIELGFQTALSDFSGIGFRDIDGVWQNMGTGLNAQPYVIAKNPFDGYIYAAGLFTRADGDLGNAYISYWDGDSWRPLSADVPNERIHAMAFGPGGRIYIGGRFTAIGGVAATNVAYFDGNWHAMGAGSGGASYPVQAIAVDKNGRVYAGGTFSTMDGVTCNNIAYWDEGIGWGALGSGAAGVNANVRGLIVSSDNSLYAVGRFDTMNGITVNNVAKFDGIVWSALGSGIGLSSDALYTVVEGLDGSIIVGGLIQNDATTNVHKWDGVSWSRIGDIHDEVVYSLSVDKNGNIYAGGVFSYADGIELPDSLAFWQGSYWQPVDLDLDKTAAFFAVSVIDDKLYVGGQWTGGDGYSATVTIPEIEGAEAYPTIKISGPGTIWQVVNYTSGKSIFFKGLTLVDGEEALLNLDPLNLSFESNYRGNLMSYILPGSDLTLDLLVGKNNISAFMYGGTTSDTEIIMTWKGQEWSIDGAVIE